MPTTAETYEAALEDTAAAFASEYSDYGGTMSYIRGVMEDEVDAARDNRLLIMCNLQKKKRDYHATRTFKIVIVMLLSFISFTACAEENSLWKELQNRVSAGATEIAVRDLTDFEWDIVCVLEPYSLDLGNREERIAMYIDGELGEFANKIPDLNDDSKWAFAFIHEGHVVHLVERGKGFYIHKDYDDNCINSENAVFVIKGDKLFVK